MPEVRSDFKVRPLTELDIEGVVKIDERITGRYRPEFWEERIAYYLRRHPDASQVAEMDGKVIGFMFGDIRAGEFGLEEPGGWIERFGVDPDHRGRDLGTRLFAAITTHFQSSGAHTIRTLVDTKEASVAGFLNRLGFKPSPLQALEIRLPDDSGDNR